MGSGVWHNVEPQAMEVCTSQPQPQILSAVLIGRYLATFHQSSPEAVGSSLLLTCSPVGTSLCGLF